MALGAVASPARACADDAVASPAATQSAGATDGAAAEVVPENASTPEKLLMFVKPGTMFIGRVDLDRCDPRDAVTLLATFIKTSGADVPLKAKMAASLQREANREMGRAIREAREAGLLEMAITSGSPMNFDAESNGIFFRLRDGADVDAVLKALDVNREYMRVTTEGSFVVCRPSFGMNGPNGAMKPMMNAAKTNRAEVVKAIEVAGDAPALLVIAPPPGSLNAVKLAEPTLPDYLGSVETKDLVDGVDAMVVVGDIKDVKGRATVVCSNPQVFADAVKKLRSSYVEAAKAGKVPLPPYMTEMMLMARVACEDAPELEVKDGAVELNLDEAAARKLVDAALPLFVDKFKDGARWENERNMRTILESIDAYAAEHGDALPRTFTELKPHLPEHEDLDMLTVGLLDDKPYVYRRPAGAGLLAPLRAADGVVLIHESLDGHADEDTISYGLTNGSAESCTVAEFKEKLAKGTLRLADGAGGQGG
jgi:hypothetical protein